MSLQLHYHPLAAFCWKVLIALYENDTPFEPHLVDLGDEASRAAFFGLWPMGKMPVLRDGDLILPESSIVIEHLSQHYPGATALIPQDPATALQARLWDRIFDLHVAVHMQKIVGDRRRPEGKADPHGVAEARRQLNASCAYIDAHMAERTWAVGEAFSLADCAAAPALFYTDKLAPLGDHLHAARYLARLLQRPSFARVVAEAEPYFAMFPQ